MAASMPRSLAQSSRVRFDGSAQVPRRVSANEPLSFFDSQNYAADLSHVFRNVRERPAQGQKNCASTGRRNAPSGVSEYLPLKGRFRTSLSMSGEVGSLAGDRVVSHERSRLADLPRREDPVGTRGAFSFALSWSHVLVCSFGRRSSLPEGRDGQRFKFD